MVGNKSDLDAQRDVTYEEAKQFADENGTFVFCMNSVQLTATYHYPRDDYLTAKRNHSHSLISYC